MEDLTNLMIPLGYTRTIQKVLDWTHSSNHWEGVYIQPRLQGQQQFLNHNTADEGMERYRQAYVTIEGQNSGLIGVTAVRSSESYEGAVFRQLVRTFFAPVRLQLLIAYDSWYPIIYIYI